MLQKVDTLYSFVFIDTIYCGFLFMFFPVNIMFHARYAKRFTFLPTTSWAVMFHVKHCMKFTQYLVIKDISVTCFVIITMLG